MIRVNIERTDDGYVRSFVVDGHAYSDEPGKDLVCAGVSAITVGTYNAIEALLDVKPPYVMRNGHMSVDLSRLSVDQEVRDRLNLLVEGMIVMLRTIEESYGKYIAVSDMNTNTKEAN